MRPPVLAAAFEPSVAAIAMCVAGIAVLSIGAWAAKDELGGARGLDKLAALANACFAAPLAVFGALHLFGPRFVAGMVPRYMPWRAFWVSFVGCALIAASLSIATKIGARWSGLLLGVMMFLFVAMIYAPGALRHPENRIVRTIVFRELSFGGAGWLVAASAMEGGRRAGKGALTTVGRVAISLAAIVFGVEHFLHPTGLPGVPLQKLMPPWVPGRALIDWATGAALLAGGGSFLVNRQTRTVAALLGAWILLLVLLVYGPVLIAALADPAAEVQVEGINYFADTLLFAGAILALARAAPRSTSAG